MSQLLTAAPAVLAHAQRTMDATQIASCTRFLDMRLQNAPVCIGAACDSDIIVPC